MIIAVLAETKSGENRVALTPDSLKPLIKAGFECHIQSNAGVKAGFTDSQYAAAGGVVQTDAGSMLATCDVLLAVNAPPVETVSQLKQGTVLLSFLYAYTQPELVQALCKAGVSSFAMDAVPRISRAQKMDALSSQANLAGYKAVLLGANALGKIFPLMMTAAGTLTPARVVIFGAGVAGLQAIATARRLGAVVEVSDVRPETKEQVESLGGRFIEVPPDADAKVEGGYAREVSAEYLERQQKMVAHKVAEADIVITTALVMGKKAPMLVTQAMVESMRPGSVVVDMAVESGGNCAVSVAGQTVQHNGVTIIGESNMPSLLATHASELYARNISTLLQHLVDKQAFVFDSEEEITKGCLITHHGQLVHAFTQSILSK